MEQNGTGDGRYRVVFVLGGPGSGKGTQCEKIIEMKELEYVHLSAGDLLRTERDTPCSKFGTEIQKHITNGTIVPVAITCALLKKAMEMSGKFNFLIDGFPRNEDNLEGWEKEMNHVAAIRFVLYFNCSHDICVNRCLDRGKTSGRTDDNVESLTKRIQTYVNHTMPIIEHYRKQNLVHEISADKTPDEVFKEVKEIFLQTS